MAEGKQPPSGESPFLAVCVTAFKCFVVIDMVV
jgi:hypothetical protein